MPEVCPKWTRPLGRQSDGKGGIVVKLVQGWGINDLNKSSIQLEDGSIVKCPIYKMWSRVLERCYSPYWKSKYKTYEESFCSEDWRYFSSFKSWVESKPWVGNEIDKDLLFFKNKEYSPEKCIFIPQDINKAIKIIRGGRYLPGVSFQDKSWSMVSNLKKPWMAKCYALRDGNKDTYLGNFETEIEAHNAWRKAKASALRIWAERWKTEPDMVCSFSEQGYNALLQRAQILEDFSIVI